MKMYFQTLVVMEMVTLFALLELTILDIWKIPPVAIKGKNMNVLLMQK